MIGSGEISEALTDMIEVWSGTEPDEDGWPEGNGIDPDAIDEWTDTWAQAAKLMAIVGTADHRDIALTARTHLRAGFALGWRCAQIAAADGAEPSERSE
jgi:hypothetical protein